MIFLGIVKLFAGLLVGHGFLDWLSRFSGGLLAVLVRPTTQILIKGGERVLTHNPHRSSLLV